MSRFEDRDRALRQG